ncbi:MAG: transporter substrate-binding domain-containing protein, partial [Chitinivibrionales bacterium]|nr:transporter substrate-binding domain-containing protein [Chitinivibrionales bacterium]
MQARMGAVRHGRGEMARGCRWAMVLAAVCAVHCSDTQKDDVPQYRGKPYHGTLARIREEGILRVITPDKEFAALPREGHVLTFEIDMARRLARRLGVELSLVFVPGYDSIIPWLAGGRGDVAMASLTITRSRHEEVDFSTPLGYVREMLIGRSDDTAAVDDVQDLAGRAVVVRRSSSYYQTLSALQDSVGELTIVAAPEDMHTHEIVHRVARGEFPLTVCDSDIADAVTKYEDAVSVLFPL